MGQNINSYDVLCGIFGEDKISERAAFLYNKIKSFIEVSGAADIAIINENNLCHAVIGYFDDISRLKHYHNIENTNKEKIVAYTALWVYRRKPIQVITKRAESKYDFINEAFITSYICDEITALPGILHISEDFKEHLFYHLKYRLVDAQSLELTLKPFLSSESGRFG